MTPAAPLQLRVSVTDRCQLRCRYCMPSGGVPLGDGQGILSYEDITALVTCLDEAFGVDKVRLTGGEPLARPGLERLVGMLADHGIPDLALTTNGLQLTTMASRLKQAGLRRVNVSLDSLSADTFRHLTGGGDLTAVLNGIDAALAAGLRPLRLNTVVIRGVNDYEIADLTAFGLRTGCEVRFIELMPIGPGAALFENGFIDSDTVHRRLTTHFRLTPLTWDPAASARRHGVTDATGQQGIVGFISSCSAPFCAGCTRLRVTADGRLIGCLARDSGVSVRDRLQAGDTAAITRAACGVLAGKTAERVFEQEMAMAAIGG